MTLDDNVENSTLPTEFPDDLDDTGADDTEPDTEGADIELDETPSDAPEAEVTLTASEWSDAVAAVAEAIPEPPDDADDAEPASAREARYRTRLRDAEAEVARVQAALEGMQQGEIQRLAAARLADPGDIFRDGATVYDMLDADDRVDPSRINTVIDELLKQHPHWKAVPPPYRGPMWSGATARDIGAAQPDPWRAAFAPKPN